MDANQIEAELQRKKTEVDARWGKTSPTRLIAEFFAVPWEHVLKITDSLIHGRYSHDFPMLVELYSGDEHYHLREVIHLVAYRWRAEFYPLGEHK